MKTLVLRITLLVLVLGSVSRAAEAPAVPFRSVAFADALKAAEAEHKVVLVDFYTTWCGPCKMLDARTWTDADVGKLVGEKAVPLRLDAEKETGLAARYSVRAYPTVLVLKPDGTEIDRLIGFREPGEFTQDFGDVLAGRTQEAVARQALAAASPGTEEYVQTRYQLGQLLAQKGKDKEALDEFLWCFDEGMAKQPAFAGVRVSFLLGSLVQLGQEYPQAVEALRTRRDAAQKTIASDPSSQSAATDFAGLNHALGEDDKTLALFDTLPKDDKRRQRLGINLFDMLVDQHRYEDALSANPFSRMSRVVASIGQMPDAANDAMKARRDAFLTRMVGEDVEVLIGTDHIDQATILGQELSGLVGPDAATATLQSAAERAGKPTFWKDHAKPPASGAPAAATQTQGQKGAM